MARQHVTVSLSGDGGDELFGGYNRYFAGPRIWNNVRRLPRPLRAAAGSVIDGFGAARWDRLGAAVGTVLGERRVSPRWGEKMTKLARVMRSRSPDVIYRTLVSAWDDPAQMVRGGSEPATPLDDPGRLPWLGFAERMMYLDALTYLPDDILVKVDRASMACSLESRAPFLDHTVVEFAWRLPLRFKVRGQTGKWVLREVLDRHVPRRLIERPKAGFGIPVGEWLRGPLRDWAESLLSERRLREEGLFDPAQVRRVWAEHQSGRFDRQFVLWSLLMFRAWRESSEGGNVTTGAAA
ncbi:MAG TPA: asparagine synthase C-terminal domain-containing protein [Gemmatimonadaceae bacterium]|nr:asparagine synthase C-terminal domain-containing protein [Gemmatimonadaceae bacterium]